MEWYDVIEELIQISKEKGIRFEISGNGLVLKAVEDDRIFSKAYDLPAIRFMEMSMERVVAMCFDDWMAERAKEMRNNGSTIRRIKRPSYAAGDREDIKYYACTKCGKIYRAFGKMTEKGYLPFECDCDNKAKTETGRWCTEVNENDDIVGYFCSVCDTTNDEKSNFCPFCGARMSNTEYGEVKRQD